MRWQPVRDKLTVVRKVECPNERCGNTVYERTYDWDNGGLEAPVWKCCNCHRLTPRISRRRHSNRMRAMNAWKALIDEWKPIGDQLFEYYANGTMTYGTYWLASPHDNYHMRQLMDVEKPSNFDVKYHTAEARKDLEKAKELLKTKQGELVSK